MVTEAITSSQLSGLAGSQFLWGMIFGMLIIVIIAHRK
jgi:hypothetical protein